MKSFKYIFFTILLVLHSFSYADKLRIITTQEAPTNYLNKQNQIVGITTDIVNQIKKELNITSKTQIMTWARAYAIGQQSKNVILFTAAKTKQRKKDGFEFLGPVTTRNQVLYSHKSSKLKNGSINKIKSQNLIIGAMRNDWRANYFKKRALIVSEVSNHSQNLNKLQLNRIDLWATSDLEAPFIAKQKNIDFKDFKEYLIFKEDAHSYILFSKGTSKQTIKQWRKTYYKLQKTDFFEKLAKKWSNILNINLQYSNEKGFYKN